jgi:haloacetate dehalogenase
MKRLDFVTLAAAAAALKSTPTLPTPGNLQHEFPSSHPVPAACSGLPELPIPEPSGLSERLFSGFKSQYIRTSGATIRVLTKGNGPPLLLIHGYPETHVTWHKVAPAMVAAGYSVVLPDLRGYGDSSKPEYSPENRACSFRAMGQDMTEVMEWLGYSEFMAAGHDRGGRVLHRMCLDYPKAIRRAAVLDIVPTLTMYTQTNKAFATSYVWWFFLIQPEPMPEHLIGNDAAYFLREQLSALNKTPGALNPDVVSEYLRCYCCRGTIRATTEDFRAAAGVDLIMDRADDQAGRKITAPLLALWSDWNTVGKLWDVLATWRAKSHGQVEGEALPCGHFLQEEQPDYVISSFRRFFVG